MGAEQVGFGGHDFGAAFFRCGVGAGPKVGLAHAHVEEVFPSFGFKILLLFFVQGSERGLQGGLGVHVDGAAAFAHFAKHHVVTQAGRNDMALGVAAIFVRLQHGAVGGAVIFTLGVGGFGLEQEEPRTHGAVTVLEAGGHEAVFHHGHFSANLSAHGVGRTGVPHGVPSAAHAFTGGAGTVHVNGTASGHHDGVGFEDVHFVSAQVEAHGASDAVGGILIEKQLHDENTFHDAVFTQGILGSFGHDALVGFTVDHDLPAAGTHRGVALAQALASSLSGSAVQVVAVVALDPAGKAPIFEQMHGVVNVTAAVEDKVFAHQTHKVGTNHADVVVSVVVAQVGIDGGKTLSHGAGAFEGGFVNQHDLQAVLVAPAHCFKSGAAGTHAAAHDEQVNSVFFHFRLGNGHTLRRFLDGNHWHNCFSLSH